MTKPIAVVVYMAPGGDSLKKKNLYTPEQIQSVRNCKDPEVQAYKCVIVSPGMMTEELST